MYWAIMTSVLGRVCSQGKITLILLLLTKVALKWLRAPGGSIELATIEGTLGVAPLPMQRTVRYCPCNNQFTRTTEPREEFRNLKSCDHNWDR